MKTHWYNQSGPTGSDFAPIPKTFLVLYIGVSCSVSASPSYRGVCPVRPVRQVADIIDVFGGQTGQTGRTMRELV